VGRHTACELTQSSTQPELWKHATASPRAVSVVQQSAHGNSTSISSRIPTSFTSQRRAIIHYTLSTIADTTPSLYRHGNLARVRLKFHRPAGYFCLYFLCPDKVTSKSGVVNFKSLECSGLRWGRSGRNQAEPRPISGQSHGRSSILRGFDQAVNLHGLRIDNFQVCRFSLGKITRQTDQHPLANSKQALFQQRVNLAGAG
jgi:hypothetical protein